MAGLLVVTAVDAERDAILAAIPAPGDRATFCALGPQEVARSGPVTVVAAGVGPAAAAAATAAALAAGGTGAFDLVLSAGVGGGFPPVPIGAVVVASGIAFADLGAETADGFAPLAELGLGQTDIGVDPAVVAELTARTGGLPGTVLTVATVTGTAATADQLRRRYPDAAAEGMEGAGVAAAAGLFGVPCAELRAVSNHVGPRDRAAWRVPEALAALGRAVAAVASSPWRMPS